MTPYGPVALYLVVAFAAALLFCTLPGLMARKKPNAVKAEAYECGVEPTSDVAGRFPVRFYLVAMLFVIFDLEMVFVFAWATAIRPAGWTGYSGMLIFLTLLLLALAYLWRAGGLEWGPVAHRRDKR